MRRATRIIAAGSIVLAPLTFGIGGELEMAAARSDDVGSIGGEWGAAQAAALLTNLDAHRAQFQAAGWFMYAAALLTIPSLLAVWWLSVDRSRRWAWTGAVLATLGVTGQIVHATGYFALNQALAAQPDLQASARLMLDLEAQPYLLTMFVPYFLSILCLIPQAVGLRRARVIPLWACVAIIAATVTTAVLGSVPVTWAVGTALLIAALAPAAARVLRDHRVRTPVETTDAQPATVAA